MSEYADPAESRPPAAPEAAARSHRTKSVRFPRRPAKPSTRDCNLVFVSAAANVPIAIVKDSPTLMVAAVEDLVWRLAVQEWSRREPARSCHAAHAAWQAEAERFDEKRARITEMVGEALMAS